MQRAVEERSYIQKQYLYQKIIKFVEEMKRPDSNLNILDVIPNGREIKKTFRTIFHFLDSSFKFSIFIVGETNSGKSTFLNCLFDDLLSSTSSDAETLYPTLIIHDKLQSEPVLYSTTFDKVYDFSNDIFCIQNSSLKQIKARGSKNIFDFIKNANYEDRKKIIGELANTSNTYNEDQEYSQAYEISKIQKVYVIKTRIKWLESHFSEYELSRLQFIDIPGQSETLISNFLIYDILLKDLPYTAKINVIDIEEFRSEKCSNLILEAAVRPQRSWTIVNKIDRVEFEDYVKEKDIIVKKMKEDNVKNEDIEEFKEGKISAEIVLSKKAINELILAEVQKYYKEFLKRKKILEYDSNSLVCMSTKNEFMRQILIKYKDTKDPSIKETYNLLLQNWKKTKKYRNNILDHLLEKNFSDYECLTAMINFRKDFQFKISNQFQNIILQFDSKIDEALKSILDYKIMDENTQILSDEITSICNQCIQEFISYKTLFINKLKTDYFWWCLKAMRAIIEKLDKIFKDTYFIASNRLKDAKQVATDYDKAHKQFLRKLLEKISINKELFESTISSIKRKLSSYSWVEPFLCNLQTNLQEFNLQMELTINIATQINQEWFDSIFVPFGIYASGVYITFASGAIMIGEAISGAIFWPITLISGAILFGIGLYGKEKHSEANKNIKLEVERMKEKVEEKLQNFEYDFNIKLASANYRSAEIISKLKENFSNMQYGLFGGNYHQKCCQIRKLTDFKKKLVVINNKH